MSIAILMIGLLSSVNPPAYEPYFENLDCTQLELASQEHAKLPATSQWPASMLAAAQAAAKLCQIDSKLSNSQEIIVQAVPRGPLRDLIQQDFNAWKGYRDSKCRLESWEVGEFNWAVELELVCKTKASITRYSFSSRLERCLVDQADPFTSFESTRAFEGYLAATCPLDYNYDTAL